MAEKKSSSSSKGPKSKVSVSKATTKDLKTRPGKDALVKGGIPRMV